MNPVGTVSGIAAPLDLADVDTDQLIPARFLRRPRAQGYAIALLHDLRYDPQGNERPGFVLNQPLFREAKILVADRNFGGGSARESAVWALMDWGIVCVIASSFADIFYSSSSKQGLLLVRQSQEAVEHLRAQLHAQPGAQMSVDLALQTLKGPDGTTYHFEIEPPIKRRLQLGLDDIQETQQFADRIDAFEAAYKLRRPWLFRNDDHTT